MKKLCALLLAVALALSMVACGKDTGKYEKLEKALESGDYDEVKDVLADLSEDFAADQELLSKYKKLLKALEKEDLEAAAKELAALMPTEPADVPEPDRPDRPEPEQPTVPDATAAPAASYSAIELTTDNWNEYLELVPVEEWERNSFDEAEGFRVIYYLRVQEKYADRLPSYESDYYDHPEFQDAEIAYAYTYTFSTYDCTFDFATMTYTLGEKRANSDGETDYEATGDAKSRFSDLIIAEWNDGIYFASAYDSIGSDYSYLSYAVNVDSFNITRIQGVIYLRDL